MDACSKTATPQSDARADEARSQKAEREEFLRELFLTVETALRTATTFTCSRPAELVNIACLAFDRVIQVCWPYMVQFGVTRDDLSAVFAIMSDKLGDEARDRARLLTGDAHGYVTDAEAFLREVPVEEHVRAEVRDRMHSEHIEQILASPAINASVGPDAMAEFGDLIQPPVIARSLRVRTKTRGKEIDTKMRAARVRAENRQRGLDLSRKRRAREEIDFAERSLKEHQWAKHEAAAAVVTRRRTLAQLQPVKRRLTARQWRYLICVIEHEGNRAAAARALGIAPTTLGESLRGAEKTVQKTFKAFSLQKLLWKHPHRQA
jgi:hypothetical protein